MPWIEKPEEFRQSILTFVDSLPMKQRSAIEEAQIWLDDDVTG